jgi:hypothetical protein
MMKTKLLGVVAILALLAGCAEVQKNAGKGLDNASEIPKKIWTTK